MFWKKNKKVTIDGLGEFEKIIDTWYCEIRLHHKEISIGLVDTNEAPDKIAISTAHLISKNIIYHVNKAEKYLETQKIGDFTKNSGQVYFSSFFCTKVKGEFDIEFNLTEWEDAYIIVHFKNNVPCELSLGD